MRHARDRPPSHGGDGHRAGTAPAPGRPGRPAGVGSEPVHHGPGRLRAHRPDTDGSDACWARRACGHGASGSRRGHGPGGSASTGQLVTARNRACGPAGPGADRAVRRHGPGRPGAGTGLQVPARARACGSRRPQGRAQAWTRQAGAGRRGTGTGPRAWCGPPGPAPAGLGTGPRAGARRRHGPGGPPGPARARGPRAGPGAVPPLAQRQAKGRSLEGDRPSPPQKTRSGAAAPVSPRSRRAGRGSAP